MTPHDENKKTNAAESFGEIFKSFGDAISEIFDDPVLKEKAKDFGRSATESARALGDRFKDEEVHHKFREVGHAAEEFGSRVTEIFDKKEKPEADDRTKKDNC